MLVLKDYEVGRPWYSSNASIRLVQHFCEFGPISAAVHSTRRAAVHELWDEISDKNCSQTWVDIAHQQLRHPSYQYAIFIELVFSFQNHRWSARKSRYPQRYGFRMAHMANWSHICDPTRKAVNSFPGKWFWREREGSKMAIFELPNGDDAVGVWKWRDWTNCC